MDIAIIGMAGRFPDSNSIDEFYDHLAEGKDLVKELSKERIRNTSLPESIHYQIGGYLDEIDRFDHTFFGISKGEAKKMDPHQRLLLEVVYHTFEDAGYSIDAYKGTNTSVFVGDKTLNYYRHAEAFDPTLVTGNLNAAMAGRIARFFDLRGSALMIDTACSSSLVGLHCAVNELVCGHADSAIVCAANLYVFPNRKLNIDDQDREVGIDVVSNDGKARTFSNKADGTANGEAVVSILIKPLEKALRDKDSIHAIIKGSAVNQDAALSGGLTAPSSRAQSEVIMKAWKNAGVDPASISYIEAHGTGTKLGDPIEIQGLDQAFATFVSDKKVCAVSSVKTNLGHADTAAGLVGLIKCVLSLRSGKMFPSLHFDEPNALIDFDNSAVYVNDTLRDWEEKGGARRAGVSSFGISGTNCHVVLEEAPWAVEEDQEESANDEISEDLFVVSGQSESSLYANMKAFHEYLTDTDERLRDIAYTLNATKNDFVYREAIVAKSGDELIARLADRIQHHDQKNYLTKRIDKYILLFPSYLDIAHSEVLLWYDYYQGVIRGDECLEEYLGEDIPERNAFLFQYMFYKLLRASGIACTNFLGDGVGKCVIEVLQGNTSLSDAVINLSELTLDTVDAIKQKAANLLNKLKDENIVFCSIGQQSLTAEALNEHIQNRGAHHVINLTECKPSWFPTYLASLYEHQFPIDWSTYHQNRKSSKKVSLPLYRFDRTRCWIKEGVTADVYGVDQVIEEKPVENQLQEPLLARKESTADIIIAIWKEVLETDEIGLEDDFFEMGGHSVNGAQVVNRLNKRLGIALFLEDFFDYYSVAELATYIDELIQNSHQEVVVPEKEDTGSGIAVAPEQELYPLSPAQRRIWVLQQFEELRSIYNLLMPLTIEGPLDMKAFEQAIQLLIERHEILRTSFIPKDGVPHQKVHLVSKAQKFELQKIDLSNSKNKEEECQKLLENEAEHVFDLSSDMLLRVAVVSLADQQSLLIFNIHHIVADGWSQVVISREILYFYDKIRKGEKPDLAPMRIHYNDFAMWQWRLSQSEDFEKHKRYWHDLYKEGIPVVALPTDFSRPAGKTINGETISFSFGEELAHELKRKSQALGGSLFNLLMSVVNILLYKYSGQEDIVVGFLNAGRNHRDLEDQIGFYVNTLPIRSQISPQSSFQEVFGQVRKNILSAIDHQAYPFDLLVEEFVSSRNASRSPFFDVLVVLQNIAMPGKSDFANHLVFDNYDWDTKSAKFDITFTFHETSDDLFLNLEYNTDLFIRTRMERLWTHFRQLCAAIVKDHEQNVLMLDYLPGEERHMIYKSFNDTQVKEEEGDLLGLFEQQVTLHADKTAITTQASRLSYGEAQRHIKRIASFLLSCSVAKGDVVGVMLDRTENLPLAILGIMKAGACYLPLDKKLPPERLDYLIEDSGVKYIIGEEIMEAVGSEVEVFSVDTIKAHTIDEIVEYPPLYRKDPAYIIYTSGSTGKPKGVKIAHGSLLNFLLSMQKAPGITSDDVILAMTTYSFDISLLELLLPLVSGATVDVASEEIYTDVHLFEKRIQEARVTLVQATPTFLNLITESGWKGSERIKILCGGEPMRPALGRKLMERCAELWNMYGPTETTIWSTCKHIKTEEDLKTVGKPINNTQVYILDDHQRMVAIGNMGEICIGGAGVAMGYHHREELSKEKFIRSPFDNTAIYRTGDLGRWTEDGEIVVLGRNDDQVKVRGHRVETGEVESALLEFEGIELVAVVAKHDPTGDTCLSGFYETNGAVDGTALRDFLNSKLPSYCVPEYLTEIDSMPLTANNKVDKKALPEIQKTGPKEDPLKTRLETKLEDIWKEVLSFERSISVSDNFFNLGGNSLKAIRVVNKIRTQLGFQINLNDFFRNATLEKQAVYISTLKVGALSTVKALLPQAYYDTSYPQKNVWLASQQEGSTHAYNVHSVFWIENAMNIDSFKNAVMALGTRHEMLRTTFHTIDGSLRQVVHPVLDDNAFTFVQTPVEDYNLFEKEIVGELNQVFDLAGGPLTKFYLYETKKDQQYLFVIVGHHIIADIQSVEIIIHELGQLYEAYQRGLENPLPTLNIQYKDFAHWQNEQLQEQHVEKHRSYWKKHLGTDIPVLDMPTDYQRPVNKTFNGNQIQFELDHSCTEKVFEWVQKEEGTPFMVFLSAVNLFFLRYTQQYDFIVGYPSTGREAAELENQVGFFSNTLALRTALRGGENFGELFDMVKKNVLEANEHQIYPLGKILEDVQPPRIANRSLLFDVMVSFQEQSGGDDQKLKTTPFTNNTGVSKYDLVFFFLQRSNKFYLTLEYNTDLYQEETIRRCFQHLQLLLHNALLEPERMLKEIDYATEDDQHFLHEINQTEAPYPAESSLAQVFEEVVRKHPDQSAIFHKNQLYSYRKLNEESNKIANYLLEKHADLLERPIAMMCGRTPQMLIATFGILKTGAFYVPLSPDDPQERNRQILNDIGAETILSEKIYLEQLSFSKEQALCIEDILFTSNNTENPPVRAKGDNLAYVMYTSGSTGQPKGVAIEQRSVLRLVINTDYSKLNAGDKLLQLANYVFDGVTYDIYSSMLNGLCLYLIDKAFLSETNKLEDFVKKYEVNITFMPTALFHTLVETNPEMISCFDKIIIGGEEASPQHIRNALKITKKSDVLVNGYGPTESTTFATYHLIDHWNDEWKSVSIGKPLANTKIYILDDRLQPVNIGVVGEIYIGGDGVARGYWNRPGLTFERFLENPFGKGKIYKTGDMGRWLPTGNIEFYGRKDNQVKIHGYRVELGEIESKLYEKEEVREVLVTTHKRGDRAIEILAYYVSAEKFDETDWKASLAGLPDYMVPSHLIWLASMPLTANGKIDRRNLPLPYATVEKKDQDDDTFLSSVEKSMLNIWREVLQNDYVGLDDNFFEVGRYSLIAARIMARVLSEYKVKIELKDLFTNPTVRALSRLVEREIPMVYDSIDPLEVREYYELSPAQRRVWLSSQYPEMKVVYNIPASITITGEFNKAAFEKAVDTIIARHEILRTRFSFVAGEPVQKVQSVDDVQFSVAYESFEDDPDKEEKVSHAVLKETGRAFDLEKDNLLRIHIIRLDSTQHVFILVMHHIISDGWSIEIFMQELTNFYHRYCQNKTPDVRPLSIHYKEFAAWQNRHLNGDRLTKYREYWRSTLAGDLPEIVMPTDVIRAEAKDYSGAVINYSFEQSISKVILAACKQLQITSYIYLTAAVKLILYKYTGIQDIIVGTPVINRDLPELENQMGMYVNLLPIRTQLDPADTWPVFLNKVEDAILSGFKHKMYPFELIVDDLDLDYDESRKFPLINILVQSKNKFQQAKLSEINGLQTSFTNQVYQTSKVDITFDFAEEHNDVIEGRVEYATELFKEDTIQGVIANLKTVLKTITEEPDIRLSDIEINLPESQHLEHEDFLHSMFTV